MAKKETKKKFPRLKPVGNGTNSCLDCDWGTMLFGGIKGAVCLHTGSRKINDLVGCDLWQRTK